jgi:hypothetical protein
MPDRMRNTDALIKAQEHGMPLAHVIALSQEIYTEVGVEFECGTSMCMSRRMPWVHIRAALSRDIPVSQEIYTEIGDVRGCRTRMLGKNT